MIRMGNQLGGSTMSVCQSLSLCDLVQEAVYLIYASGWGFVFGPEWYQERDKDIV